jgi:hypothetical protein
MKVKIGKYLKGDGQRKISVEIEKFDTYSLDHTLALIILPALLQIKELKQGIPNEFANSSGEYYDGQLSFDFDDDAENQQFQQGIKQWDEILDKMIWSFQQIAFDNYDSKYHHGLPNYDFVEKKESFHNPVTGKMEKLYQMVDFNPNDHWYDHVGHKLHEDRIQEGLELFGRFYRSLWD